MKILFLAPYPIAEAPSQRFRFEHFLPALGAQNIKWEFQSFYTLSGWHKLYSSGNILTKVWVLVVGFWRRLMVLRKIRSFDFIHIHRELTPIGPPIFEWIIARVLKAKIIYDFDDAIWMNDGHDSPLMWLIKARWKVGKICEWSWKVTAGNEYLRQYAGSFCNNSWMLPTIVDTDSHMPVALDNDKNKLPVIGWTGSHSTLFYLDQLLPILQQLEKEIPFKFLVIANKDPKLPLANYEFVKWNKDTEVEDLRRMDIGVMPLIDNDWSKGKCGFKLIQYLSVGIPAIASPVGVNEEIVVDGKTGFLAATNEEWLASLKAIINDINLRIEMGIKGRQHICENYSVASQTSFFLSLFEI